MPRIIYSCVVDDDPRYAYQAWHLVRSLERHCDADPSTIHVQFLPECDIGTKAIFRDAGYRIHTIERFGDGRFCNKLGQIDNLIDRDFDIVVLLDTDMIAVSDLRPYLSASHVIAKIVDCPNPALGVLDDIGRLAGLTRPREPHRTDDGTSETYSGNCNGGFYAVPKQLCAQLSDDWRRWALWLLLNIDPLRNSGAENHVDQVSFWLAIENGRIPLKLASSNVNYYIHFAGQHVHADLSKPVALLHYHNAAMSTAGGLECSWPLDALAEAAVEVANTQIASSHHEHLFRRFRAAAGERRTSPTSTGHQVLDRIDAPANNLASASIDSQSSLHESR